MKKSVFSILVVLVMVLSYMFLLTGCSTKNEKVVSTDELTLETLEKKADVIILGPQGGMDCITYINYYIDFSESKLYVYEYFKAVPLEDIKNHTEHEPEITIKEYNINKDDMEEFKDLIEEAKGNNEKSDYTVKVDGKEYKIKDVEKLKALVKRIDNK